jgi:hypothetical protein
MTEQISIFAYLPDMLFPLIFEFANDGAMRLVYHPKKKCFVDKINPHFALLNAANQFKIDNPPEWDVDDPNFDEEFGTTEFDIMENLTFKYPLKFRIREGTYDRIFSNDGYLELMFSFSKSFNGYRTNKCAIALPEYYHSLSSRAAAHYQNQMKKHRLSKRQEFRIRNLIKGFSTLSFAPDVAFV